MTDKPSARDAIIETASVLIRTYGVQGMSIAQLVTESGTSAGAIYHHFSGKNDVIVQVARQAIGWPLAAIAAYQDSPASPAELLEFSMTAQATAPGIGELLAQLGAGAGTDDELGQYLRAEFAVLRDAVEETMLAWAEQNGVAPQRVRGYSQLLIGLSLGYATQRMLVDRFDEAAYRRQAVALLELPLGEVGLATANSGNADAS